MHDSAQNLLRVRSITSKYLLASQQCMVERNELTLIILILLVTISLCWRCWFALCTHDGLNHIIRLLRRVFEQYEPSSTILVLLGPVADSGKLYEQILGKNYIFEMAIFDNFWSGTLSTFSDERLKVLWRKMIQL